MQHRQRQQVAGHDADQASDHGRDADPGHVRGDHLRRAESDALQHADPPVAGHHRAGDDVSHDQDRHEEPDQRERLHERREDRAVAGGLLPGASHDEKPADCPGAGAPPIPRPRRRAAARRCPRRQTGRASPPPAGAPAERSTPISLGSTQASAVLVIELATPTTVSCGLPGAVVTVIFDAEAGKESRCPQTARSDPAAAASDR